MIASDADREGLKGAFLAKAGFSDCGRTPMTGDASTRQYERLTRPSGQSFVLMDQPPSAESEPAPPDASDDVRRAKGYNALTRLAAGRIEAFVAVAGWLRSLGLSAPEIIAYDAALGFAVIEDLGEDLYARLLLEGAPAEPLYSAAVDVQLRLQASPPPTVLAADGARWPLSTYDALALKTYTDLFLDWWPQYAGIAPFPDDARESFDRLTDPIRREAEAAAAVFSHRDFHAENLLWLPGRSGLARVGLLDFQDAVLAPPSWDLLHLLQDARRDVPEALERAMLDRYLTNSQVADPERFLSQYRALAALNAARILGPIFARQVVLFKRPKYVALIPRTWRYLERNLGHPDLEELKAWFDRWLPASERP